MTDKASPNPAILQWARDSCNLTIEDVAIRMKKKPEAIAAWESGRDAPTYVQLETLAYELYRRPIAVFFMPKPPAVADVRTAFRTLPEAEVNQLSPTIVRILRKYQVMQMNVSELCRNRNPSRTYIFRNDNFNRIRSVPALSILIRRRLSITLEKQLLWRSPSKAFEAWRKTFEDHGIFVFKDAFRNNDVSGFCLYHSEFPVIVINNSMTWTRQVFTLFHELAHLIYRVSGIDLIHDDFVENLSLSSRRIERICNCMASVLLVPDDDFDTRISGHDISEDAIVKWSLLYSVSREVILRKLFDRGLVSQSVYCTYSEKWIKEIRRIPPVNSGGDYFNNQASYFGSSYLNLVFGQYLSKRITDYQLADYLNMKVENAKSLEYYVTNQ